MGLLNWLGWGLTPADPAAHVDIVSPWAPPNSLAPALVAEALGLENIAGPVSPSEADALPAVARAKSILTATIAPLPLRVLDRNGEVTDPPTWTYRSNTPVSPYARMAATVLDGFYNGNALWATERAADGSLLDAAWVPRDQWRVNRDGFIEVKSPTGHFYEVTDPREVIFFDWPGWAGLLTAGASTVRGAAAIESAWISKARNPIPVTVLRQTEGYQLEDYEVAKLLSDWRKARTSPDGALGFLPQGLTLETHGTTDPELFEGARNAIRLDIANYAAIPAVLLDGSLSESTLTYSTTEGNRSRLLTETVPFWCDPIAQRLSQDDVVPRGKRVRFDLGELISNPPTDTGAPVED